MNIKPAIRFLKSIEWTMGNGQCDACCGHAPRQGWWTETVGHKRTCRLAKALASLGVPVVWERPNHSKEVRKMRKAAREMMASIDTTQVVKDLTVKRSP